MKLHLPLGLLVAVLASFQVNAKSFNLSYKTTDWQYDEDAELYRCHLPFPLQGITGNWMIETTIQNTTSAFLSTLPDQSADFGVQAGFRLEIQSNKMLHNGWLWAVDVLYEGYWKKMECRWTYGQTKGNINIDLDVYNKDDQVERLGATDRPYPPEELGWVGGPICDLWSNTQMDIGVYAVMDLEESGEYVVARGDATLGSYEEGGTGLLTVWGSGDEEYPLTQPVLNTDAGEKVGALFLDPELAPEERNTLRFVAKGRTTIQANGESRYQRMTVGAGGVVYTEGDFYAKGITVDKRATGYTLNVGGNATLGDGGKVQLHFDEDFTLTGTGALTWDANNVTFEIAEGKTVHLNMDGARDPETGEVATGGGDMEVGARDIDRERIAGGTLSVGGSYALGEGEVTVYGSTLNMNGTAWQNRLTLYSVEDVAGNLLNAGNAQEGTEVRIAVREPESADEGEGETPGENAGEADPGGDTPLQEELYVDFELGGLKGDYLKSVDLSSEDGLVGGRVHGIGGGTVRVGEGEAFGFVVTSDNISYVGKNEAPTGGTYMMEFRESGAVEFDDGGKVRLVFTDEVLKGLEERGEEGGFVDVWFTNGELTELKRLQEQGLTGALKNWFGEHFELEAGMSADFFGSGEVPLGQEDFMGGTAGGGGVLRFMLRTDGVWVADVYGDVSAQEISDPKWEQVRVNADMTVTYEDAGDNEITLRNLNSGSAGSGNLTIVNKAGAEDVTLVIDQRGGENVISRTLRGSIILDHGEASNRINLTKEGADELEVTGNVENAGKLTVKEGQFTIGGNLVKAGTLSVVETQAAAEGEEVTQNKLILNGGENEAEKLGTIGQGSVVEVNGVLTLTGNSKSDGQGTLAGKGAIVTEGALDASEVLLDGVGVELDGSKASLVTGVEGKNRISALCGGNTEAGSGSVTLGGDLTIDSTGSNYFQGVASSYRGSISTRDGKESTLTVTGESTDQTLRSKGDEQVNLTVDGGAHLTLIGETGGDPAAPQAISATDTTTYGSATYGDVTVRTGSTLAVLAPGAGRGGAIGTQLQTEGLTVEDGGRVEVYYNLTPTEGKVMDAGVSAAVTSSAVVWGKDATLVLGSLGINPYDLVNPQDLEDFAVLNVGGMTGLNNGQNVKFELEGSFRVFWEDVDVIYKDDKIVVNAKARKGNIFAEEAGKDENVQAGAQLMWAARTSEGMNNPNSALSRVMNQVAGDFGNVQTVSRTLAGVAGSTVPITGTAQRDAMRAEMLRMRDHAGAMGLEKDHSYDSLPYTYFWLEASGDFANLDDDGMTPGYKYNSWGGTVGMETNLSERTSLGLGLSALYGDLDGGNCDRMDGNMDSYYLSLMARFARQRWGHTLVGVVGLNSVDVDRTVPYGAGNSYTTHGSTDGWGVGFMYELTYDVPLNEERTQVLQPLVGASIMRTTLDGYNESGQGVGLNVGEQEWVTSTLALGLRWISTVGASVFNTAAQLELRANIAQDVGDSQGSADVALQANPGVRQTVKAAEVGKTAAQLGAALRMPISEEALLYFNVGADLRSGMNTWNMTAGLKYNF